LLYTDYDSYGAILFDIAMYVGLCVYAMQACVIGHLVIWAQRVAVDSHI